MELVANIWPIVDQISGYIQRYAARGYCMMTDDRDISDTLRCLARSDFMLAQQFPIPDRFKLVTDQGELSSVVSIPTFNQYEFQIIETALKELEETSQPLQGVGLIAAKESYRREYLTFPANPFRVVTFLIEDPHGRLTIYGN